MHDAFYRAAMPQIRRMTATIAAAALLAACGGSGATTAPNSTGPSTMAPDGSAAAGAAINVTEAEFKIEPSATSAAPGAVTFHITNSGTQAHEFVVIKTDTSSAQLPMASDGAEVDEDASGLTPVGEVEDIAAGASADLPVNLEAGHYVLICNVPGHYSLGMRTDFTVGS